MNRSHELVPHRPAPAERPTRAELSLRVASHRERLRRSLEAMQRNAPALSPAHQFRRAPVPWLVGAMALGFVLGALTAPRRPPTSWRSR